MMTSAGELRRVEDEFVDLAQNWSVAPAPLARGSGEEPGGGGTDHMVTVGSPTSMVAAARRWCMSAAAKRGRGRAGGRPGGPAAHPEHKGVVGAARERTAATEWCVDGGGSGGGDRDGGVDCRLPAPIPCARGRRPTARSRWRRRLASEIGRAHV